MAAGVDAWLRGARSEQALRPPQHVTDIKRHTSMRNEVDLWTIQVLSLAILGVKHSMKCTETEGINIV